MIATVDACEASKHHRNSLDSNTSMASSSVVSASGYVGNASNANLPTILHCNSSSGTTGTETNSLLHVRKGHLGKSTESLASIMSEASQPPPALYIRRSAIVPEENKIFEDSDSDGEHSPGSTCQDQDTNMYCDNVVIIPSMKVALGDIQVYNRAITNRGDALTELQKASSAAAQVLNANSAADMGNMDNKRPKAPWIFKRLYEWSHRAKAIEVVRHLKTALQRVDYSEYYDENIMCFIETKSWGDLLGAQRVMTLPEPEKRRVRTVWELFQSELSFLYNHLLVLRNVFKEPLKECQVEGYLLPIEPDLLFGNLEELCQVSHGFCKELLLLLVSSVDSPQFAGTDVVVKIFDKFSKRLSPIAAYQAYCINYKAGLDYLESARKLDDRFAEFEKITCQDPRCNKRNLEDLLIAPLHRITRIPLLLKEIQRNTQPPAEKQQIGMIIETMEESLRSIDDSIQWLHNFERLQELQGQLVWPPVQEVEPRSFIPDFLKLALSKQFCENLLAHPRRKLIHEGILSLVDHQKQAELYCFLFNDMMLLTKAARHKGPQKSRAKSQQSELSNANKVVDPNLKFTVQRTPIPLDSCVFCDISPQDGSTNNLKHAFVILHLTRFYQVIAVYTLKAPTKEAKEYWIKKFQESIDNYESIQLKDMLKCTPLIKRTGRSPIVSRRTSPTRSEHSINNLTLADDATSRSMSNSSNNLSVNKENNCSRQSMGQ